MIIREKVGRNSGYRIAGQEKPLQQIYLKGGKPWRTGVSEEKRKSIFKYVHFFPYDGLLWIFS